MAGKTGLTVKGFPLPPPDPRFHEDKFLEGRLREDRYGGKKGYAGINDCGEKQETDRAGITGFFQNLHYNQSREKMKRHYVYLLANKKDGDIYAGSTDNLLRRVGEHKNNSVDGFTKNSGIHNLVYYEEQDDIHKAITREKQIKKWKREWKVKLIEKSNPEWKDLYFDLIN